MTIKGGKEIIEEGGLAFTAGGFYQSPGREKYFMGLTKREWFAGMALSGNFDHPPVADVEGIALWATAVADAVLKRLESK